MATLRGTAQPSDCPLTHILLAYWRKLLTILLARGTHPLDAHCGSGYRRRDGRDLRVGDAAYRRVQSHAGFVRGPIQVYCGSGAFTIPYIDPTPEPIGVCQGAWMR
jgi:hypothetical protein